MAGNVRVVLKSVFDDKGINQAQKAFGGLSSTFGKVAATLGTVLSVRALGDFARNSVKAASDLEESMNAVNVAFGDSAKAIQDLGKTASTSLGTSQVEFNQAAVRFSAFADRIVGSGGDASKFIKDITQRASDFASVFNIEVSEALQVFQSGLAGEAEPLKRFGINLLDSEVKAYGLANGIGEAGRQMTETEKVQARYGLLLQSTAKTAGDFANTSDGLANSQRIVKAQFADLQATIGNAVLPAVTKLFQAFAAQLLPKMREFGDYLKSPAGVKLVNDLAIAMGKAFDSFFKFLDFIVKNWRGISEFATAALSAYTAVKLVTGAVQLATTAQLLFNTAVKANPYMLAVTALLALVTATVAFANSGDKAGFSAQAQADQVAILESELEALERSYNSGAMDMNEYERQVQFLTEKLNTAKISVEGTAGEMRRMNDLRLDGAIESMNRFKLATSLAERQAKSFRDSYSYLESIGAVTSRTPTTTTTGVGGGAGVDAAKEAGKLIKNAEKAISKAQKSYDSAVKQANKDYVNATAKAQVNFAKRVADATTLRTEQLTKAAQDNARRVSEIQADFAKRLDDIVRQSQNRLRDAYSSAVQVSLADLFNSDEVAQSVDGLVKTLQDKLKASRKLVENAANLSARGFSQTFIEQIVGAGTQTGNELAEAILLATPEAQMQLKELFGAIETEGATGMDALAQTIYEKSGLATQGLKDLYQQTTDELTIALGEQSKAYAEAQVIIMKTYEDTITDAERERGEALRSAFVELSLAINAADKKFKDSLKDIRDDFKNKMKDMKGELGKVEIDIDRLINKMKILMGSKPVVPTPPPVMPTLPLTPNNSAPINGTFTPSNVNLTVYANNRADGYAAGEVIINNLKAYQKGGGPVNNLLGVTAVSF